MPSVCFPRRPRSSRPPQVSPRSPTIFGEGVRRGCDPSRELGDQRRRERDENESTTLLNMLLLRYPGEHTAKAALKTAAKANGHPPQVELIFETAKNGKRRVSSPTAGVADMVKEGIIGWGVFGLAVGAITASSATGAFSGRSRAPSSSACSGRSSGVRRRPLRPLGGARGVGAAAAEGRAADAARQLGHPRPGPPAPPPQRPRPSTGDGRSGDASGAFNPVGHGAILEV